MKLKSFVGMRCSIAGALEAIGDRWAILVIRDLALGFSRYEDLRASLGIPTTTLAKRLKHLEAHGLVERERYRERPPRDAYRLTEKGHDLWKVTLALREWGERWDTSGYGAANIEVTDRQTGRQVCLVVIDPETGSTIPRERIDYRPGPDDEHGRALLDRSKGAVA